MPINIATKDFIDRKPVKQITFFQTNEWLFYLRVKDKHRNFKPE